MMLSLTLPAFIILYGGLFACILALGQVFRKDRSSVSYTLAALCLCLGCSQIIQALHVPDLFGTAYHMKRLLSISTYFCVGPLIYSACIHVIDPSHRFGKRHLLFFVPFPASAVAVWLFAFILRSPQEPSHPLVNALSTTAVLWTTAFIILVIIRMGMLISRMMPEKLKVILPGLLLAITAIALSGLDLVNRLFALKLRETVLMLTTFQFIGLYLFGSRYPVYQRVLREESDRIRYKHSCLRAIDVESVLSHMAALMEAEKAFLDETLTLQGLALRLGITAHQLSELLNTRYGKNFRTFVNGYRVREAQEILRNEPREKILSVGFSVGFGTSAAFHAAFRKETGMSPVEYKKIHPV